MDEHVLLAGHRLDEPITLGRVEPLDGALLHRLSPCLDIKKTRPRFSRATPQTGFRNSAQFPSLRYQGLETHSRTAKIRLRPRLHHENCTLASFWPGHGKRARIRSRLQIAYDKLWRWNHNGSQSPLGTRRERLTL